MIPLYEGFQEGWNELYIADVCDVTLNDKYHSLMIEGVNELNYSRLFFIFYNQTELLQKIAHLGGSSQDDYIDESLLIGTTHWFELKKNGRHLNIVDVRPFSDTLEHDDPTKNGGE